MIYNIEKTLKEHRDKVGEEEAKNIEAAIAVGMQAIQYTTHNAFEQQMHARGLDSLLQLDGLQLEGHPVSQNGKI